MRTPRRHLLGILAAAAAAAAAAGLGLVACALLDGPNTLTLSPRELDALMLRAFPVERRVLDVFDASVRTPRLRLLPQQNRLGAQMEVALRDRFLGSRWQGDIDFDGALHWQASDQTLRLRDVRVQDLRFVSVDGPARSTLERVGAWLAERLLEDMVLYRLTPDRAAHLQRLGRAPGAVAVTARGVEVTFQPLPR